MQCILCEQEGKYSLRASSTYWQSPLHVEGIYCHADFRRMLMSIADEVRSQIPHFETINTPKPQLVPDGAMEEPQPPSEDVDIEEGPEDEEEEAPAAPTAAQTKPEDYIIVKKSRHRHTEPHSKSALEARRKTVQRLWDMGKRNTYEIAELIGVGRGAVYADLRMLGIKPKHPLKSN